MARNRSDWLMIALLAVVVLMSVEIVWLVRQNGELERSLAAATRAFVPLGGDDRLPRLSGVGLDGEPLTLAYGPGAPRTLLLWFSPACDVCEGNLEFWNELLARHGGPELRFFGLCGGTDDEARAFVAAHDLRVPVLPVTDGRLVDAYRGHVLPQTVLVSGDGVVLQAWPGALDAMTRREVEDAIATLAKTASTGP